MQLTQEELWTFNIFNNQITNAQAELQRLMAARNSYIKLLEDKYDAKFDAQTGTFIDNKDKPSKS